MTGKMYDETLGKLHFWLILPAFYVMSVGQMRVGLLGMRRRIADYDPALGFDFTQLLITISGFVVGISTLVFIYNVVRSIRGKERAAQNPWNSLSPEFLLPSPLPEHNYHHHPVRVVGSPYDYGLKDARYVEFRGDPRRHDLKQDRA
jgi:cytochrome c oxidase subunit 1